MQRRAKGRPLAQETLNQRSYFMPKSNTISVSVESVEKATQLELFASEIRSNHATAKQYAELAVVFALRTGIICHQAKQIIGKARFKAWMADACPDLSLEAARRYMNIAENIVYKKSLPLPMSELTAGDFLQRVNEDSYRSSIVSRVRDIVGVASVDKLYEAYGITKHDGAKHDAAKVDAKLNGFYNWNAARLRFDRAYKQTVDRLPEEKWTADMVESALRKLRPIAELVKRLEARSTPEII